MEDLRKLLDGEIASEIKNLSKLTPGEEKHSTAVEAIAKLYKLRLEDDRNEKEFERRKAELEQTAKHNQKEAERRQAEFEATVEHNNKELEQRKAEFEETVKHNEREFEQRKAEFEETVKQNEADNEIKKDQLTHSKIDIIARAGSIVVPIAIELMAYGHWYNKGLKFEETGALTSQTLRGVMGKFNPFKK